MTKIKICVYYLKAESSHVRFYLSPLTHTTLSQSQQSSQHVMADLWKRGKSAASCGFLKNANPLSVQLWWAFPLLMWACAQQCASVFLSPKSLFFFVLETLTFKDESIIHSCFLCGIDFLRLSHWYLHHSVPAHICDFVNFLVYLKTCQFCEVTTLRMQHLRREQTQQSLHALSPLQCCLHVHSDMGSDEQMSMMYKRACSDAHTHLML